MVGSGSVIIFTLMRPVLGTSAQWTTYNFKLAWKMIHYLNGKWFSVFFFQKVYFSIYYMLNCNNLCFASIVRTNYYKSNIARWEGFFYSLIQFRTSDRCHFDVFQNSLEWINHRDGTPFHTVNQLSIRTASVLIS